jgi:hypothetical protein
MAPVERGFVPATVAPSFPIVDKKYILVRKLNSDVVGAVVQIDFRGPLTSDRAAALSVPPRMLPHEERQRL